MLAVAVSLAAGLAVIKAIQPVVDDDTLCVRGRDEGQTIVLLDKTDIWNANQSDRLEKHILTILNEDMKEGERLHVFAFGAAVEAGFTPRFMGCKPPDGSRCRGILCNPEHLSEQYRTRFLAPLLTELKTLKIATQGACSPIAEALFEVLSRKEIKDQVGRTQVVLLSDLAQNTPTYTVFKTTQPSCPGVSPKADPDKDQGLVGYLARHQPAMRTQDTSAIVIQLYPDRRSEDVGERAKAKWTEAFRQLRIPVRWYRL